MTRYLDPPPKIVTFDCYGTLVQWQERLHEAIEAILLASGRSDLAADEVLRCYSSRAHTLQQTPPHLLYRRILTDGFTAAFAELDVPIGAGDVDRVIHALTLMGPHPETQDVLRRLRTRYRTAIFTNSDDDLIAHAVRRLAVPFDYVITAERARAYKPSRTMFEYGHRCMGVDASDIVHVAMSMELDMQACHALGMRGIWINRNRLPGNPDWLPYEMLFDLNGVPALLGC